jgi:hypothetical protein
MGTGAAAHSPDAEQQVLHRVPGSQPANSARTDLLHLPAMVEVAHVLLLSD